MQYQRKSLPNGVHPDHRPPTGRRRWAPRPRAFLQWALALALGGGGSVAMAGGTSPVLSLTSAVAVAANGSERVVTASGAFNFDDVVQVPFPAAGLMVASGSRFVRYEVDGSVVEATSNDVKNGVTSAELPGLLGLSGAPTGSARLLRVQAREVAAALPTDLPAGNALVLLYAEHDGEFFVSNAIPVVLP